MEASVLHPGIFSDYPMIRAGLSIKSGKTSDPHDMNMSYKVGDESSRVDKNRRIFFSDLGVSESDLAVPLQCHSSAIKIIRSPGEYNDCDALITNVKEVALGITIADCVPILIFDPVNEIVAAVHAGWRGTQGRITEKTIDILVHEYSSNPSHVRAFIGPSAGACCYEVSEEVAVLFNNKIVPYSNQRFFLDLKKENKIQLQKQGLSDINIEVSPSCTICEKEKYHSYRRDGKKSGRMLAIISMIN